MENDILKLLSNTTCHDTTDHHRNMTLFDSNPGTVITSDSHHGDDFLSHSHRGNLSLSKGCNSNITSSEIGMKHSPAVVQVTVVFLILLCIPGTAGNSLVIYCIVKQRHLRQMTHFLAANFCVLGWLISAVIIPRYIYSLIRWQTIVEHGPWCQAFGFIHVVLTLAIMCNCTAIAINRYILIAKPHLKVYMNLEKWVKSSVGFLWCFPFVLGFVSIPYTGYHPFMLECFVVIGPVSHVYILAVLVTPTVVTTAVVFILYFLILQKVFQSRRRVGVFQSTKQNRLIAEIQNHNAESLKEQNIPERGSRLTANNQEDKLSHIYTIPNFPYQLNNPTFEDSPNHSDAGFSFTDRYPQDDHCHHTNAKWDKSQDCSPSILSDLDSTFSVTSKTKQETSTDSVVDTKSQNSSLDIENQNVVSRNSFKEKDKKNHNKKGMVNFFECRINIKDGDKAANQLQNPNFLKYEIANSNKRQTLCDLPKDMSQKQQQNMETDHCRLKDANNFDAIPNLYESVESQLYETHPQSLTYPEHTKIYTNHGMSETSPGHADCTGYELSETHRGQTDCTGYELSETHPRHTDYIGYENYGLTQTHLEHKDSTGCENYGLTQTHLEHKDSTCLLNENHGLFKTHLEHSRKQYKNHGLTYLEHTDSKLYENCGLTQTHPEHAESEFNFQKSNNNLLDIKRHTGKKRRKKSKSLGWHQDTESKYDEQKGSISSRNDLRGPVDTELDEDPTIIVSDDYKLVGSKETDDNEENTVSNLATIPPTLNKMFQHFESNANDPLDGTKVRTVSALELNTITPDVYRMFESSATGPLNKTQIITASNENRPENNLDINRMSKKLRGNSSRKASKKFTSRSSIFEKELRLSVYLFVAFMLFSILYLPITVLHVIQTCTPVSPDLWLTSYSAALSFSTVTWILYGVLNRDIRKYIILTLKCKRIGI